MTTKQVQDLIWEMAKQEREFIMKDSPRNAGMEPKPTPLTDLDRPLPEIVYALTGAPGDACVLNTGEYKGSEVTE